jgi:threonine dehydratase
VTPLLRTPLLRSTTLGEAFGGTAVLKAELFQKTGSFKPRRVFNKLLSLPQDELARGLVSLSAGNHAAALAYGAAAVGTTATIVMPATALPSKIEATRAYGGEVVLMDGSLLDACLAIQRDRNLTLVHPFDDLLVIAGQGTVGLEILEDLIDVQAVIVPVGGDGLISGIATAIKRQRPNRSNRGGGAGRRRRHQPQPGPRPARPPGPRADHRGRSRRTLRRRAHPAAHSGVRGRGGHRDRRSDRPGASSGDAAIEAGRGALRAAPIAAMLSGAVTVTEGTTTVTIVSGGNVDFGALKKLL